MAEAELDFHDLAAKVFHVALSSARDGLLDDEHPLDLDQQAAENWLDHDKDRFLDALEGRPTPEPRAADVGDPAIQADKDAHAAVEELLKSGRLVSEEFCLVGEEAPKSAWHNMQQAPPGSLILALDAIDGSGPYENLTLGYGSTLLALRRRGLQTGDPDLKARYKDELQGAAVCNSSGFWVSMTAVGGVGAEVLAGFLFDESPLVELVQPEFPPSVTDSVAVVAAKPEGRRRAQSLLDVPKGDTTIVYNTGGAPAALGLLLGRLGAMVSFENQTMWDTAYLPIFAALGIQMFLVPSGEPFGVEAVTTWFSYLTHERHGVRPVPPFLATRRVEDGGELLRRISLTP